MHTPRSAHRRTRPGRPVQALAATLLAAALALTGCSAGGDSASSAGDKAAAPGAERQGADDGGTADSGKASGSGAGRATELTASSIIRTASLTVRVKDVPRALDTARTAAEDAGGYVGDENTTRDGDGGERTRVVLRVPAEKYDGVLADLEGTGKVIARTAKAEDVTDQVVDVDSRVASQRAGVARIRELMNRATKLSDVVTLEGELSSREADLESLLAQQASLKDRVSLATITLSLTGTPVKKAAAEDDGPGFVDALDGGWHVFLTLLRWIALAIGATLPFLVVIALLVLLWVRLLRPRLPRRPAPPAAPAAHPVPGPLPSAPPVRGEDD